MAFTDLSITWNAVAKTLPRISTKENYGQYAIDNLTEGNLKGSVAHFYNKRTRRVVKLDLTAIAADPLLTGTNVPVGMATYLVIDLPKGNYFSSATQAIAVKALADWIKAGTNLDRVIAGEN